MKFFNAVTITAGLLIVPAATSPAENQSVGLASVNLVHKLVNGYIDNGWKQNIPNPFWAGSLTQMKDVKKVSGEIIVPTPKVPRGSNSSVEHCTAVWVGIDGYTCGSLLQTGIQACTQDGTVSYQSWYEWFPVIPGYFAENFSVSAGDTLYMEVNASSKSSGNAILHNKSNGQRVSHAFIPDEIEGDLCLKEAEWLIEHSSESAANPFPQKPMADLGTVTFTNASAESNSTRICPSGNITFGMVDNEHFESLAMARVCGDTVSIAYTGI